MKRSRLFRRTIQASIVSHHAALDWERVEAIRWSRRLEATPLVVLSSE
jgi:hypothetical protein